MSRRICIEIGEDITQERYEQLAQLLHQQLKVSGHGAVIHDPDERSTPIGFPSFLIEHRDPRAPWHLRVHKPGCSVIEPDSRHETVDPGKLFELQAGAVDDSQIDRSNPAGQYYLYWCGRCWPLGRETVSELRHAHGENAVGECLEILRRYYEPRGWPTIAQS